MADLEKKIVIPVQADTKKADAQVDNFKKEAGQKPVSIPVNVDIYDITKALQAIQGMIAKMEKSFDKDVKFSGLQKGLDEVQNQIKSIIKLDKQGNGFINVNPLGLKEMKENISVMTENIKSLNNTKIDLSSFERLEETFKNIETLINSIVKGMNFDAIRPSTQVQEEIESITKNLEKLAKTEERINKLEKKFTSRTYKTAGALILADDFEDDEKQVKDLIGYIEEYVRLGGDLSKFKFNFIDEDEIKTSKSFLDVFERLKEDKIINFVDSSSISNDIKTIQNLRYELESLNKELIDAQIRENRDLNVSLDTKSVEDFSLAITKAVEKVGELHFDIPEGFTLDGLSPENLEKIVGRLDEIVNTIKNIGDLLSTEIDTSKLKQELQEGLDFKPFDSKDEIQSLDTVETKVKNITSAINEKTKAFKKEELQVRESADKEVKALSNIEGKIENITQTLNKEVGFNIDTSAITNSLDIVNEKLDEIVNKKINPIVDYSSVESISDESGNTLKWYRGVKDVKSGFMSDKDDGTFFTTNKELAAEYAGELGKVYEAELKMKNVLEVDVNGGSSELFEYLGTQSDEASIKITELSKSLKSKTGELTNAENELSALEQKLISFESMPGMSIMANTIKQQIETTKNSIKTLVSELDVLQTEYDKISDDRSNPYGMVGTHDVSSWAAENGLDGVIFNNIKTSVDGITESIGSSAVIFSPEQLNNLKVAKNIVEDLHEEDKPINIPISPDTTHFREDIQEAVLSDKPIEISISPNIDRSAIEEQVRHETKEISTALSNTSIKDTFDASATSVSTEQNISDIKAETAAVEENTQALKENQQAQEKQSDSKEKVPKGWVKDIDKAWDSAIKENDEFDTRIAIKNYESLIGKLESYYALLAKKNKEGALNQEDTLEFELLEKQIESATKSISEFNGKGKEFDKIVKQFKDRIAELNKESGQIGLLSRINTFDVLSNEDIVSSKTEKYKPKLEELESILLKIKGLVPIDINSDKDIKELDQLNEQYDELVKNLRSTEYIPADQLDIDRLSGKISDTLRKNTAAPREIREQLKGLIADLEKLGLSKADIDRITRSFVNLETQMKVTGKTGDSLGTKIQKKFKDVAAYFATYVSIQDAIQVIRQGFETINEYDKALTEMNKVSDESIQTLKEFQEESFGLADSIGTTASALQNSVADWQRLGESLEEAKQSAQDANILFNVSEFETIDEATDSLVSMSQAFKDLEKGEIIDVVNNLGWFKPKHTVMYGDI